MAQVSVIIPTFNRSQKIVRAVRSVLNQDFRDFEIVVVDDGSTDNTGAALNDYMPFIRYLRQPVNRGVSAARNRGVESSAAPWISFLDSDDYWLREKLRVQMEFLQRNPSAVACQTQEIWIRRGRRVNPKTKHKKPSGDIFKQSLKLCLVSPSSIILRRSLFEDAGFFDEGLPAGEDYDLWLRISCRYPVYLIDKELVVKEGGQEDQLSRRFGSLDRFRIRAIVRLIKSGILTVDQTREALEELSIKCRIYGNGCIKRGRMEEGYFYLSLPQKLAENGEALLNRSMPFLSE
jgi:glycosyltransferase involved in cell wall biosynthesis